MCLIMRVHRHLGGEKGLQCGENRKGCVMSFPYQCLVTAILTSCPAGLAGICRLTPLPSPCTPNTHTQTATHFALLLMSRYWLVYQVFPHSLTRGYAHASSKELFPLCAPPALYTSCLSFSKRLFLKSSSALSS